MTGREPVPKRSAASSARRPPSSSVATAVTAIALKRALALGNEAAFLWVSRSYLARSSAVTFAALAHRDERLSSLVYKLSERQVLAERLLQDEHPAFKSGRAFVTAVVALRSGAVRIFDELVMRLQSDTELLSPLASALAWLDHDEVHAHVERLLASPDSRVVRLGLVAAVTRRVDPGARLDRALDSEDPLLRGSALEAAGRLGAGDRRPKLRAALEDEDAICRFWGAWGAVRLGDGAGISVLGRFAVGSGPLARPACDMALRALEPDRAVHAHARLLSITSNDRLGVLAAGIIGDPALASWLLNQMEFPSLARRAGAAFCLMTGLDLRRDDLDSEGQPSAAPPEVALASTSESAGGGATDVSGDPLAAELDDDLAWPDTARLRQWWDRHRHAFIPDHRYLAGVPIRPAGLATVLRTGNQQQRAAAALELALLNPDAPLLDTTAPAHRQGETADQFF